MQQERLAMSMRKGLLALLCAFASPLFADQSPELGEPVDAETLASIDFTVMPDGRGLPAGSGTAREGADVYLQHCVACHGNEGAGSINDRLVGGHGSLDSDQPIKTIGSYWPYATTVFDYIRRAMPLQQPGPLSDDEIYAVTAYLLYLNGIVEEDATLTATSLPEVEMPNRDGFSWDYSP